MTSRLIVNGIRHTELLLMLQTHNSGDATIIANVTCSGTATGFGKPPKATK